MEIYLSVYLPCIHLHLQIYLTENGHLFTHLYEPAARVKLEL